MLKFTLEERIAAVILEDIYYILKDKKEFNEKEFIGKLSKLR